MAILLPPPTISTHPGEEESVIEQVVELLQALLHSLPPRLRQI